MVSEAFSSFFSNIRQKTTNPFLGTLMIVWSISNWELLYSLFTFDSYTNLEKRISIVQKYITEHQMFWNLLLCIVESIAILVITYLLLNLSRLIVNLYENLLTPRIYEISKSKRIILLDKYEDLERYVIQLEKNISEERNKRLRVEEELDKKEKQLLNGNSTENSDIDFVEKFDSALNETDMNIAFYDSLIKDGKILEFKRILTSISTGVQIHTESEGLKYFALNDIVKASSNAMYGKAKFELTENGKLLKEIAIKHNFEART